MNEYKPKHPIKKGTQNYLLSDYVNTILDETGVDIRIKSRRRHQQDLQKIFCKFAHWHLRLSLSFIGKYIDRDHASVLHACRKYDNLYATDKDFRQKADFFIGRFLVIDAKEETLVIKKALTDKKEQNYLSLREILLVVLLNKEEIGQIKLFYHLEVKFLILMWKRLFLKKIAIEMVANIEQNL